MNHYQHWVIMQFENLNVLMLVIMITFVTAMSKANTTKQLKSLSEEFYKEFEEIKDELREHHQSILAVIQAKRNG
jgi:hypothetical protein